MKSSLSVWDCGHIERGARPGEGGKGLVIIVLEKGLLAMKVELAKGL